MINKKNSKKRKGGKMGFTEVTVISEYELGKKGSRCLRFRITADTWVDVIKSGRYICTFVQTPLQRLEVLRLRRFREDKKWLGYLPYPKQPPELPLQYRWLKEFDFSKLTENTFQYRLWVRQSMRSVIEISGLIPTELYIGYGDEGEQRAAWFVDRGNGLELERADPVWPVPHYYSQDVWSKLLIKEGDKEGFCRVIRRRRRQGKLTTEQLVRINKPLAAQVIAL